MKLSKRHKQWICIMFAFTIVLSGICTGISQGNVFLSCQNIPEEAQIAPIQRNNYVFCGKRQSKENSSQKYQVTHTSFVNEDCHIEDNSARILRKVSSMREEKRGNRGKSESFYSYLERYISRCQKNIQDKYIDKAKSIESINKLIISYIHRKDGAKGIRLFF